MASIVVCGGSIIGSATALLLANEGHEVTVLERDPAPPPDDPSEAWQGWDRKGVAQFHQPHNLFPRFRQIADADLPGLTDDLLAAGCVWVDPLAILPPFIQDKEPRAGDDRFRFVTGRRPVVESVVARAAERQPGVTVRRGVAVAGLLTGPPAVDGVPHVTGVRTGEGEELPADLVVDATGRRSRLADWLSDIGTRPPYSEAEDAGFVYHTRYFTGPQLPARIGPPVAEIGTFSLLTLPGDNGTWSVTVWTSSSDAALKALRDNERYSKVVRACPLHQHWLDGEPITDVLTMAGVVDRYRRFVVDGQPVVTGVAAVGDAWACTNPSAGRGMTVGLIHAQALRDVARDHLDDPAAFAGAWDEATETRAAPFYWNQIRADRARFAEMEALRNGAEPPAPDPMVAAIGGAAGHDPDVFRGVLEMLMCLALPQEVVGRPGFLDKVMAIGQPPMQIPGPDRAALLDLMG